MSDLLGNHIIVFFMMQLKYLTYVVFLTLMNHSFPFMCSYVLFLKAKMSNDILGFTFVSLQLLVYKIVFSAEA